MYKKGKSAALNVIKKHQWMQEKLLIFNNSNSDKEIILKVGHEFVSLMYGLAGSNDINDGRFKFYNIYIGKQTLERSFDLAILPPTKDALNQHILR